MYRGVLLLSGIFLSVLIIILIFCNLPLFYLSTLIVLEIVERSDIAIE